MAHVCPTVAAQPCQRWAYPAIDRVTATRRRCSSAGPRARGSPRCRVALAAAWEDATATTIGATKEWSNKLELADIKAGVAGPKASAESNCKKHAKGGEKVKIKLSISGPAGTVLSSSAEDDAGNAALGSCVAAELKKATFKKVQKEQIGTVVSVSF